MASKAQLIAQANTLRRHWKEEVRRSDYAHMQHVLQNLRFQLQDVMTTAEVDELLPPGEFVAAACRLTPLADHVVVLPDAAKATTEGGLVIPDSAQEVPMRGRVLATGPGAVLPWIGSVPMTVAVGQAVLFGRYAGVEVLLDGEQVRIMREEDILGILAPETT